MAAVNIAPAADTMRPRVFESRHTATKAARRLRPEAPDRLVQACEACPTPLPSRRRPPAWCRIARDVAAARSGSPAGGVRQALDAARAADRERRRAVDSSRRTAVDPCCHAVGLRCGP